MGISGNEAIPAQGRRNDKEGKLTNEVEKGLTFHLFRGANHSHEHAFRCTEIALPLARASLSLAMTSFK